MTHIATFIANPANPVLSVDLVTTIAKAINSKNTYWLADGIACDCLLPESYDPANPANPFGIETSIRGILNSLPIDVVVHEQYSRRRKALIADMDSTMIEQECIDELAAEVGLKTEVSKITKRAMNGEIPFEPALKERVALLKGLSIEVIEKVINDRITLTPGGKELLATMKSNGAYTALVSGGFTHFTKRIAQVLGFNENRANILCEEDGLLSGTVQSPILGMEAKVAALNEIAGQQGLLTSDFIAVGDGANDLGMLQAAGAGVALHAKPAVSKAARIKIDHGDLTALLYIQGYRKAEFSQ